MTFNIININKLIVIKVAFNFNAFELVTENKLLIYSPTYVANF